MLMGIMTNWPEVLRSFRHRNQLKQEAAASLLGVSQAYVSKVENGAVQPSAALLKRLAILIREPQHRPTLGLFKAAVRHAPALIALLGFRDGMVIMEESSRAFNEAGHPFDLVPRAGELKLSMVGESEQIAMAAIAATGAFQGKFGLIESVWTTAPVETEPTRHFRTVFVPLRTDQGDWLLQATVSEISEAERRAAEKAWGGTLRFFDHDVEPPLEWP
jgi:transcriptional regulator with XRE-family HTH domain